ncbi:MAG: hypothetical protein BGO99_03910 [Nitrosospira sp. 56-18]|nr:MAG: hypothetical protein BGO99_03910 [Nitrosospira sp. 56-18]
MGIPWVVERVLLYVGAKPEFQGDTLVGLRWEDPLAIRFAVRWPGHPLRVEYAINRTNGLTANRES